MNVATSVKDPLVARSLRAGGIGVIRTDTLYGVIARADDEAAVQRVYELKGRDDDKSPIVLIDSIEQIYDDLSAEHAAYMASVWPGPFSVIVPAEQAPSWIARGNGSVAYRMPAVDELRKLIRMTGPLIAPSANPQGAQPALDVAEATAYFGSQVDFYVDGGRVTNSTPSSIIRLEPDGSVTKLR